MLKYILILFFFLSSPIFALSENRGMSSDRDAHGCVSSLGYSWLEGVGRCIRSQDYPSIHVETPDTGDVRLDTILKKRAWSILETYRKLAERPITLERSYSLKIHYTLVQTGAVISVRTDVWEYTGGMHGNTSISTSNFDTSHGRDIPLFRVIRPSDLTLISKNIETALVKKYGSDIDSSGLSPKKYGNFRNFNILTESNGKPKAIVFNFSDYQVGPYSLGMPRVTITWPSYEVISVE